MPTTSTSPIRLIAPSAATTSASLKKELVRLVPELRGRAISLCKNETAADDLVQDTVERALRFASQYERGTNLRAWMYQILFSVFITRYRRQRREQNALRAIASNPYSWPFGEPSSPEAQAPLTASMQNTLDALPKAFRQVLILVDLEEQTYRDAAKTLGVPVGTVMSRLHRGRRLLADKMQKPAAACAA